MTWLKKIQVALLMMLCTGAMAQTEVEYTTPKELAEAVFETLQQENYYGFESMIFTAADCDTVGRYADAPDTVKQAVVAQMKQYVNEVRKSAKKNFNDVIKQCRSKGINWPGTTLTDVKYSIENRKNTQLCELTMVCMDGEKRFEIVLLRCQKAHGWLMADRIEALFE